ncbi:MAG TPA: S41 family peptidase [Tepidiformaceae bacterium]|nr:S41 family peptidase [Tepidiformaceae bacterium]HNO64753.1 S41 family peptidase [Tepidiformaceae bacterium]
MEIPQQQPQPSFAERTARNAVVVFLLLAIVTLAFGLGWLVQDLRQDDAKSSSPAVEQSLGGSRNNESVGAAIIDEIVNLLKTQYVDKSVLNEDTLRQAAIDGIIGALNDSHTEYLSPAELKAGALSLDSSYDGIGASVSDTSGAVTIVTPFRDSPAEKAGIRQGDIVLKVDGEATDGWTSQQAVERIRGQKGTDVTLEVKHTDGKVETLTITRGEIPIESVFTEPNLEIIPGESGKKLVDRDGKEVTDIAYIAISQFHDRTVTELRAKLQGIESKGYKGLILDLRSNPGGLLQATVDVADEFLASGTIISEVDANGGKKSWSAKPGGLATKIPIVILQDNGSASGSEVLASALRDNGRAQIVGVRSFGKGTVNQLQQLKNCGDPAGCGALYLSVGRWLTPKGDQIEGLGVKPDIELPMTYDEYLDQGDIQMFKAIDLLHGK